MEIFKQFKFEAAHWLPGVPEGHKCRRMHGHSYRVKVVVRGMPDAVTGMVLDFAELTRVCGPVIDGLDHRVLNEIEGLENPTAERLAVWIWDQVEGVVPGLTRVEVLETANSGVVYEGPGG